MPPRAIDGSSKMPQTRPLSQRYGSYIQSGSNGPPEDIFGRYFSYMTTIEWSKRRRLSPSKCAPKILCKAYEAKEFPDGLKGQLLRLKHADEVLGTSKRLLSEGYVMLAIEVPANGGRIDLLVKAPDGRKIAVEVKRRYREFKELDKIQAALYWSSQMDAVAIASRHTTLLLTPDHVQEIRTAAHFTQEFLDTQPELARVTFTPHPDVCTICKNDLCPHRDALNRTVQMRLNT